MRNDLELIFKDFDTDVDTLRVYALGDIHVGSREFDEKATKKAIKMIESDPHGVVCLCGDLGDYGLKNSKTNIYQAVMNPQEQQDYIYELFLPIKDKIAAAVPGNHEERLVRECGLDPLLVLCCKWGIEDVYRENVAITKYTFGSIDGTDYNKNSFVGITTHGSSQARHRRHIACYQPIDFATSGHIHTPMYAPHGVVRIDSRRGTATWSSYKEIVVDAHVKPGGYGIKKEYEIPPTPELQYLELSTYRDGDRNRTKHKVMDFHSIQL